MSGALLECYVFTVQQAGAVSVRSLDTYPGARLSKLASNKALR